MSVEEASSATSHFVTVGEDLLGRHGQAASPEALIEASFRFLLEREPKESIMGRFDLTLISQYFPEYESEILDYL
ncbi:MAG: hypothetical protein ACR2NL_10830 [Acidimicrobiia bacterium]